MTEPPQAARKRQIGFEEFWQLYLRAHTRTLTRIVHYVAAGASVGMMLLCLMTANLWFLVLGVAFSFALGGISHLVFERNRSWVLGHPLWSLACCYRMSFSALTGHIREDLTRAGL